MSSLLVTIKAGKSGRSKKFLAISPDTGILSEKFKYAKKLIVEQMILKSGKDIEKMRAAGLALWQVHQTAKALVAEGVTTMEIDTAVERHILARGALALFKGVPGRVPYPAATCISINDEVVHGIPSQRRLVSGDIVSIDIGVKLDGWCADAAVTWAVGTISDEKRRLMTATENALRLAIAQLATKPRWSLIAKNLQRSIEQQGFSVVRNLMGHGIGREMWEPPNIPNFFNHRNDDFTIRKGATLAIEPMVNLGGKEVVLKDDHWTIATRDGSPSAHFEHTIAITPDGPKVLTCGPDGEGWAL